MTNKKCLGIDCFYCIAPSYKTSLVKHVSIFYWYPFKYTSYFLLKPLPTECWINNLVTLNRDNVQWPRGILQQQQHPHHHHNAHTPWPNVHFELWLGDLFIQRCAHIYARSFWLVRSLRCVEICSREFLGVNCSNWFQIPHSASWEFVFINRESISTWVKKTIESIYAI